MKGATHNRQTLKNYGDIEFNEDFNKNIALKDVDLINNHRRTFDIDFERKTK